MKHILYLSSVLLLGSIAYADTFDELFERANRLFVAGNMEAAIHAYEKLLAEHAQVPQVQFNLATAYFHARQRDKAIPHYMRAIELNPKYLKAFCQLGRVYADKKNMNESILMYRNALAIDPGCLPAAIPLARQYNELQDFQEALNILYTTVTHHPDNPDLLLEIANTLLMLSQYDDALPWFLRLVERYPQSTSALYGTAYTLKKLSAIEASLPYYQRIFELEPEHSAAQLGYALALLITGNYSPENWSEGLRYYESRWNSPQHTALRQYAQPLWDGSDPAGKTFFLWAEQGLGDTFQFMRYAQVLKDRNAARVILAVQKPIMPLAQLCPYIDQVIALTDAPPAEFDYHAPLMSMPFLTKTTVETIPNEIPYLNAAPEIASMWANTLADDPHFKIGICWQGNPDYPTLFLRMAVAAKSMSIKQFIPIMEIPGVSVYSLQKMSGTDQIAHIPDHLPFYIFDEDFDVSSGRFMDTAAVIKQLDLVITIDTAICHLAGALGVPVWNLLPEPSDWRWMMDCDNTPWYPNMRLFRQPIAGDWQSVINTVVTELTDHLAGKKPLIYVTTSYTEGKSCI